jgi:hypothetical protein
LVPARGARLFVVRRSVPLELLLFVLEDTDLDEREAELMECIVEFAFVDSESTLATIQYASERIDR